MVASENVERYLQQEGLELNDFISHMDNSINDIDKILTKEEARLIRRDNNLNTILD